VLSEIRIESLGAISTATAEFDRGLTVLTGETGTGKTMVVTGLHLLGGARADATRVRSGAARAVVEGRFTTTELGEDVTAQIDEILDSSGAERDDDGSVIAARSVTPRRTLAGLSRRPQRAREIVGHLHHRTTNPCNGQNDQLRLMRPTSNAGAWTVRRRRAHCKRYRAVRDDWLAARRDLADRTQRARELAQEADRLKFGSNEIDTVAPQPGEDDALVADIRRLSELDALREAAQTARAALSGRRRSVAGSGRRHGVGQAKSALEAPTTRLRALARAARGRWP
jgi:DNA repair protein RecN (Recombination protein N)